MAIDAVSIGVRIIGISIIAIRGNGISDLVSIPILKGTLAETLSGASREVAKEDSIIYRSTTIKANRGH